jgi:hypothetical protein
MVVDVRGNWTTRIVQPVVIIESVQLHHEERTEVQSVAYVDALRVPA